MKRIPTPQFWRRLPLARQLLLAVNSFLLILVATFLVVDHRLRIRREFQQTRIALAEEAKTLYESAIAIDDSGSDAVQKLVDSVCARMNSQDSPGHHIALRWQGKNLQAQSHGRASSDMYEAMVAAANGNPNSMPMADSMVVGSFDGPAGRVYVSEKRSNILAVAREALLRQMFAVLLGGVIAAAIVSLAIRQIVTKPMRRMEASLQRIGNGDLNAHVDVHSCRELAYLGEQINEMRAKLDAVEQDRRVHMEKAKSIQQNLRPKSQAFEGVQVAELFEPADDVGGDYYDVIRLSDGSTLLCVADVSGHGVPAAMAATLLKSFVTDAAKLSNRPAEILDHVNRKYYEYVVMGHFATMVLVRVDSLRRQVVYANAGHELPFIQSGDGPVERLEHSDLILGVEESTAYEDHSINVCKGSKIVIVSDGVTEAFNPSEDQFGTDRVESVISVGSEDDAKSLVRRFANELHQFRERRAAFDDTTLLVAQIG
tara:strand:- start:1535 stop:2989 length:1455 start_codon:yes stop_codon:yes gene_type:complete